MVLLDEVEQLQELDGSKTVRQPMLEGEMSTAATPARFSRHRNEDLSYYRVTTSGRRGARRRLSSNTT